MKNTRVLIRAKGRGLCIERGLHECLQRELFTDVTFNCSGGRIRANRGVLAAASPVLCQLLRDWPLTDDACVIMAGYTEEEVQGLVQYIYTGQLSSANDKSCGWQKIINDFKVGLPFEGDEDSASEVEGGSSPVASPVYDADSNGVDKSAHRPAVRSVGPKIVAVTSPRPLVVQVQSLVQSQGSQQDPDDTGYPDDTPLETTTDGDVQMEAISNKRKRGSRSSKRVMRKNKESIVEAVAPYSDQEEESLVTVPTIASASPPKSPKKRTKASAWRKKYACPHCKRRFLTRGNLKNHTRIHKKDKPFQCVICKDFFAYQGVYQRHLMRHRAKDEISEPDMALVVEGSLRLAEELARIEQEKSLREAVSVGELHIDDTGDLIKFLNARKSEGNDDIGNFSYDKTGKTYSRGASSTGDLTRVVEPVEDYDEDEFDGDDGEEEDMYDVDVGEENGVLETDQDAEFTSTPMSKAMAVVAAAGTPYQCSLCDEQFTTMVILRSHVKKLHNTEQQATNSD